MKKVSLGLTLTVLLIATLCFTAAAQGWNHEHTLSPNAGTVNGLAFVDNDTLISASGDRLVRWDVNTGSWSHYEDVGSTIYSIAIPSHVPFFVAYGKSDGSIGMRYTDDLLWRYGFNHGIKPVTALSFDKDSYQLASGEEYSSGPDLKIWDVGEFDDVVLERVIDLANRTKIWDLRMHPTEAYVLCADGDSNVDEWHENGSHNFAYSSASTVYSVAVNSDGSRIAGGSGDDKIRVWDYESGDWLTNLVGHVEDVDELAFSPTQSWVLASGSDDDDVHVWDIEWGTYDLLTGHTGDITAIAFSPNGGIIASGSADGTVRIWRNSWLAAPAATSQAEPPLAKQTALLANYPNPFNPETWIPYQLAAAAEVTVTIHASDGKLVRALELGQMPAGVYQSRSRAAYWDGRNAQGELVASGVYFYTLTAGDFKATRKMVIRK